MCNKLFCTYLLGGVSSFCYLRSTERPHHNSRTNLCPILGEQRLYHNEEQSRKNTIIQEREFGYTNKHACHKRDGILKISLSRNPV